MFDKSRSSGRWIVLAQREMEKGRSPLVYRFRPDDLGLRCFHRACEQEEKRDEKHASWNVRRTERWFHTTSYRREMMKYFETRPGIHASTWLFGRLCPVSPWKEERLERRIGANDCGLFGSAST